MKLYELLLRKLGLWDEPKPTVKKAEEEKIYNPIGCKIGGVMKIDSLDLRDHRFAVKEIREYAIGIGGSTHRMVDYVLLSRPIGKEDYTVRLRVVPDPDSKTDLAYRSIAMTMYDSMAYSKDFEGVVRDTSGGNKFVIDDDADPKNVVHDEFWRVNDVTTSYVSGLKTLADTDGDGTVEKEEVQSGKVEFWDYSRITPLDGVDTEEFVFVEMNKSNGWFQIWRGIEVDPARVSVF